MPETSNFLICIGITVDPATPDKCSVNKCAVEALTILIEKILAGFGLINQAVNKSVTLFSSFDCDLLKLF